MATTRPLGIVGGRQGSAKATPPPSGARSRTPAGRHVVPAFGKDRGAKASADTGIGTVAPLHRPTGSGFGGGVKSPAAGKAVAPSKPAAKTQPIKVAKAGIAARSKAKFGKAPTAAQVDATYQRNLARAAGKAAPKPAAKPAAAAAGGDKAKHAAYMRDWRKSHGMTARPK